MNDNPDKHATSASNEYWYQEGLRRSAEYNVPWLRQLQVFLMLISFPLWIVPYWFMRTLRRRS